MQIHERESSVTAMLAEATSPGEVRLAWLGQAGFAMRYGATRLLIDPYLSDSLAVKYAGKKFPHTRMMPAPVAPEELRDLDYVLCTHRHTDHMDPVTLRAIAEHNPRCLFVIPASETAHAIENIGLPQDRLIPVNTGDRRILDGDIRVHVVASAHETREQDDLGRDRYLGYTVEASGLTLYHSGDTILYDGLAETLEKFDIDLALLPCNGRDAYRREHGVPGNMSLEEAITLTRSLKIPVLVPHHFGMFDFNTCAPAHLEEAAQASETPRVVLPRTDRVIILRADVTNERFDDRLKGVPQ